MRDESEPYLLIGDEDPDFLVRAYCYLEAPQSADEITQFQDELAADPHKCAVYIRLCQICAELSEEMVQADSANRLGISASPAPADLGALVADLYPRAAAPQAPAYEAKNAASPAIPSSAPPAWKQARQLMENARRRPNPSLMRGMAAAILVLSMSLAWFFWGPKAHPIAVAPDSTILRAYIPPTTTTVPVLPVELPSGFARLTLDGGVQILIEGPARYSIITGSHLRLLSGRLTAIVPHGVVGFTVETKEANITDLGTEFGVIAGYNFTETEVFDGRVAIEPREDAGVREVLGSGQADHVASTGKIQQINVARGQFVRVGDYDARQATAARNDAALDRWSAFSRNLRKDPSLLAYYTFDSDNEAQAPRELLNRAQATGHKYDGDIENATWDQGHFPGRRALHFNGNDSLVRINIPDQSSQMTLATWVRVDSWAHFYNGLLMSDGWSRIGEIHWQFIYRDQITAGALGDKGVLFTAISPLAENALEQWVFRAVTLDANTSTIALYRNGIPEMIAKSRPTPSMSIGSARIGNWDHSNYPDPDINRTIDGSIDELAIFNRVLSATEIREMYQAESGNLAGD